MADPVENSKLCGLCGAPGSRFKCSCKTRYFCGANCQKNDWKDHKKSCPVALSHTVKEKKRELERDDIEVAKACMEVGRAHEQHGRFGEAERCYQEALRIFQAVLGEGHPELMESYNALGVLYGTMKRYSEARQMQDECLGLIIAAEGKRSANEALTPCNIGALLQKENRHAEALSKYDQAFPMIVDKMGRESNEAAMCLVNRANACAVLGDSERALGMLGQVEEMMRGACGGGPLLSMSVATVLGSRGSIHAG